LALGNRDSYPSIVSKCIHRGIPSDGRPCGGAKARDRLAIEVSENEPQIVVKKPVKNYSKRPNSLPAVFRGVVASQNYRGQHRVGTRKPSLVWIAHGTGAEILDWIMQQIESNS
jgi:hypothetical protein